MAGVKRPLDEEIDDYPVDNSLSVIPTEGEAQYEAFQSIFAKIMSSHYPPKITEPETNDMSPYELLCFKKGIKLFTLDKSGFTKGNGIYFKQGQVTHYIAFNNIKLNPYDKYQPRNTQGFCQMFAYFMYVGDVSQFQFVDQTKKIDVPNFKLLAENTYRCGIKSIKLLRENPDIYMKFDQEFKNLIQDKAYGIKAGTTLEKYLADFEKLQLKSTMYYIYDQPLVGYRPKAGKPELWLDDELRLNRRLGGRRKTQRRNRKLRKTKKTY